VPVHALQFVAFGQAVRRIWSSSSSHLVKQFVAFGQAVRRIWSSSSSHLVKQFVAFGQQEGPQNVEEGFVLPAHEGAVDAAVMTKLFRQLVPLAACSQAKDNAVEGLKIMPSKD